MQKKSFKLIVSLLAGITLGSSVIGSGVSIANASEVSVSEELTNDSIKQIDNFLLKNGFTYREVKTASIINKKVVYTALVEKSERGEFAKKLLRVLRDVKGRLGDWLRHINILDFVGFAVSIWNAYDGEPTRIIYHTLRHFGASKHDASRWSRVIVDALGYL